MDCPAVGVVCGLICGAISGDLVAVWKLPPFIVMPGMWQIVPASNFLYSGSELTRSQVIAAGAPLPQFFGNTVYIGGAVFTYGVILLPVLVAILSYTLGRAAWRPHVYALGGLTAPSRAERW